MSKRVFLLVADSLGIGALPDAAAFGDEGSNTLDAIRTSPNFSAPTLEQMGLFHIVDRRTDTPLGAYARMSERSVGKDTTVGHWEIAGYVSRHPFPTYPEGFPPSILNAFCEATGRDVLCNRPYSGTEVIRDYGETHLATGALIVYTSADSVFQIAAHEDVVPPEELYRYCRIARSLLTGEHGVGRVIARPFAGEYPFYRTPRRHDFSLPPPSGTLPSVLLAHGIPTVGVGKIGDIFAGVGIGQSLPTRDNAHGYEVTLRLLDEMDEGLCFVNFVDFDAVYGHRNDVDGYADAVKNLDAFLSVALTRLREEDLLILTADHGCDPSTPSTDHSREYTPCLIVGHPVRGGTNLGTRQSFADIGATVLSYFGITQPLPDGDSFLHEIL